MYPLISTTVCAKARALAGQCTNANAKEDRETHLMYVRVRFLLARVQSSEMESRHYYSLSARGTEESWRDIRVQAVR